MIRFLLHQGILSALVPLLALVTSCSKREASYESQFKHLITVHYPEGNSLVGFEEKKQKIDRDLRATKAGFVSGVLCGGNSVDFLSIDTDFDLVDEQRLIERYVENGWLPAETKVEYERDPNGDSH
ncbi:hypothetical protein DES53_1248 [Roseimicrobium gellanilyticum]|uniref:Uncharacterized protein n=1 Tax=Roseimicrobium gellanilyticum TaxID=748857 RepID=A0A366H352_9BACT|nr:hypothetical protein [Roseimicrobium gellanilyticum]RBP35208.1 hypothetical protein DES53_1248 [Roseimicrobium gellanilyticum]